MTDEVTSLRCEELWRDGSPCDDVVVLDVRTPAEFREAHIPGSINVPLGDLPRRIAEVSESAGEKPIALVCRTGRRAESARDELQGKGLAGARVLEGGLVSWLSEDLPVNRGEKAVSVERQVRIAAGAMIVLGVLLGQVVHTGFHWLAAFVGAGLVYSGATDTCAMGTVLTRMPWNRAKAAPGESLSAKPTASGSGA